MRTRFEVLKRDAEIAFLKGLLAGGDETEGRKRLETELAELDAAFAFVAECNLGGEFMAPPKVARLERIAARTWTRTLDDTLGLSVEELSRRPADATRTPATEPLLGDRPWHAIPHDAPFDGDGRKAKGFRELPPRFKANLGELHNLRIPRGTLTEEDRFRVNDHIVGTIRMLEALPLPKGLRRVAEWAGAHHERPNGTGYPRGLRGVSIPMPARIIAVADVFEALTAADRPYRRPKRLSEAMAIMARMADEGHIDPDVWRLQVDSGVWREYAETFLQPWQID